MSSEPRASLNTAFTDRFGCRVPIMGTPMAGVSGGTLAAATARGGALGFIAAGHLSDPSALAEQVALFRALAPPEAPLCIGFVGYSSMSGGFGRLQAALDDHRPSVVQFFAPALVPDADGCAWGNVAVAKKAGSKVVLQVGSVEEAKRALEAEADCIVAQGREAGGHGLRTELGSGTLPLAARVAELARGSERLLRPCVLAAGGITCGKGLAAALALGCDGAVLGTRLWASAEALGKDSLKRALVEAEADDVLRTTVFDTLANAYSPTPWPAPFDSVGALHNKTSKRWHGKEDELEALLAGGQGAETIAVFRAAVQAGDAESATVLAGEGVGAIGAIEPAEHIILRIEVEAIDQIRRMSGAIYVSSL
eukprot:CAMPEP_0115076450 /NCGR_PEP_ID=MMETSP0227-20121206/16440_1 /TAXON_ID=89957 /ORGANISM="Polarella glacialis, Strain CCMP 1383" /LENGTH=366 /DNA_ID=CAMNT_0002463605 /DNA_START=112 /DNA_END=1212 /DNA_ORIENTATION=-